MSTFGPGFGGVDQNTSDLIRATRRYMQGTAREPLNELEQVLDEDSDTLVAKYPVTGIQVGSTVEVGWVEYSVVDTAPASKTLKVVPLIEGTSADFPVGTRVRVNPRYPVRRIIEEINSDLSDLSSAGLYRVSQVQASDGAVTLPEGSLVLLEAWSNESTVRKLPASFYDITDTVDGPILKGPATLGWVNVGRLFDPLSVTEDQPVAATTGLWPQALDLPPMGAALRLLAGSESQRNLLDAQSNSRRAEEVPPGAVTTSLRNLAGLRQSRIVAEVSRLQQRYGLSIDVAVF